MKPFRVHPQVEKTFLQAQKMSGGRLDIFDCWKWLVELEAVAKTFTEPEMTDLCADIDGPLAVGDTFLYFPSPAQLELCSRMENSESPYWRLAIYFILSHDRSEKSVSGLKLLSGMTDEKVIARALKWSEKVTASDEAMRVATDWLFGITDSDDDPNYERVLDRRDWSTVISSLMAEYAGLEADYWMSKQSCRQLMKRSESVLRRRESKDARDAAMVGKMPLPSVHSSLTKAKRRYNSLEALFFKWVNDHDTE